MKKLYYFSRKKLKFVEIENYKQKLLVYFSISVVLISGLFFGTYAILDSVLNSDKSLAELRKENKLLRSKLKDYSALYNSLNEELDSLTSINNYLRIAANLHPLSQEEKMIGTGGGFFNNLLDFSPSSSEFKKLESYIENVKKRIDHEKNQYHLISDKFKERNLLFESIPAIRPSPGSFSSEGFGMRLHPILRIVRMHEGIDIITHTGTPVFATGRGVIDFVGNRGGYGATVEVKHGFGYRTIYAHLSKTLVKEGQQVNRGTVIALSGNSGLSTGPHLHYEVQHNGVKQNPEDFFFDYTGFYEFTNYKLN